MKTSAKPCSLLRWALLGACVAGIVLAGCERDPGPARTTPVKALQKLVIITPHSEDIRETFAAGFTTWHLVNRDGPVHVQWIYRGTPQCVDYIQDYANAGREGRRADAPDLMFGGGIGDHVRLAKADLTAPANLDDLIAELPERVHGVPTHDPEAHWIATGLSSFGILYHEQACQRRGIAPPETWADLADPRFYSWVSVAHPRGSGSHQECMVLILEHAGWEKGWGTLMRILGNTRALNARSRDALRQVEAGAALATFAVNFDGKSIAARNDGRLRYVDPPGATAVTPDIISIVTTGKEYGLAQDFIRYVLSEEGQALWGVHREHRSPHGTTLYHYPILPAVYEKQADHLAVDHNPVAEPFGMEVDPERTAQLGHLVKALVDAACGAENHIRLQQLWRRIIDAGMPAEALAALTAPPFDAVQALEHSETVADLDSPEAQALIAEWRQAFADKYAQVDALLN